VASGQTGCHSLVRLWDLDSKKCVKTFCSHDHSLSLLEYSKCGSSLVGIGKDKQNKQLIIVWSLKMANSNNKQFQVDVIGKAHVDVRLNRILFLHFDSSRLLSCGCDTIRFWKLSEENETMRCSAINLQPYLRKLNETQNNTHHKFDFIDIAMNSRRGSNDNLAYACSRNGVVFILNVSRLNIDCVKVICEQNFFRMSAPNRSEPIEFNTIDICDDYCAIGSNDGFVRVWPLDFSRVIIEAQHSDSIVALRFETNNAVRSSAKTIPPRTLTLTKNGNLGVLFSGGEEKSFTTLQRSHTGFINDLSVDKNSQLLLTCSQADKSIRLWDIQTYKQLKDFNEIKDEPVCVTFRSNDSTQFACGFTNGKILIFNIEKPSSQVDHEILPVDLINKSISIHTEITRIEYTLDGKYLVSSHKNGSLNVYNSANHYKLTRSLKDCVSSNCKSNPFSIIQVHGEYRVIVIDPGQQSVTLRDIHLNEINRINVFDFIETNDGVSLIEYNSNFEQLLFITNKLKLLKFNVNTGQYDEETTLCQYFTNRKEDKSDDNDIVNCSALSSDGRLLATSINNSIVIWNHELKAKKNFQVFIGHSSPVGRINFINNDRKLITVGDSIIIWDIDNNNSTNLNLQSHQYDNVSSSF
jgi:WD repeat-containing protein 90